MTVEGVVVHYCGVQEGRSELENVVGMGDCLGLVETLGHQEDQSRPAAEVHTAEILDLAQSLPEVGRILCRTGLADNSHRREEDGGSLEARKVHREADLEEVDQVAMHSECSRRLAKVNEMTEKNRRGQGRG